MLKSQSINFSYDGTHQFSFPDIQLSKGEDLLVLGQSGVGKTTLLQILAGLLKPSSGLLEFNGVQFHNLSPKELDRFRGKHIGIVFQSPYFVKNISILDNLYFLFICQKIKRIIKELSSFRTSRIGHKINSKPNDLSQGNNKEQHCFSCG